METIQAGLLADITNFIKTLSKSLSGFLDKLIDAGARVQEQEKTEGGGVKIKLLIDDQVVNIEVIPTDDDKKVDILITYKGGENIELKGIYKEKVEESIVAKLEELGLDYSFERIKSSKKLSVSLQKVVSKTSTDIRLTAINANYDPGEAMHDLDAVLYENKFIDLLNDQEQSFDIIDEDDAFGIYLAPCVDTSSTCEKMLYAAMELFCNLKTIHWNAAGPGFWILHEKVDEYITKIQADIDILGELCVEINGYCPNPGKLPDTSNLLCGCQAFQEELGFNSVQDAIAAYILTISTYSVNYSSCVQGELDSSVRYWTKEANYKLNRMKLK